MSYTLEKATALLVGELKASPDSPLAHPTFQHLLSAPAGDARDAFVQAAAQQAGVTLKSIDLPASPPGALHDGEGIKAFAKTLRDTAQSLQNEGGGLMVINDLGRTSQVLQAIATTSMSSASLLKAGLSHVHVLWTTDPDDRMPASIADKVVPLSIDLSAAPTASAQERHAHVRIPDLNTLVGQLPVTQAERSRAPVFKSAHA